MILGLDRIQALIVNNTPPLISNLALREIIEPEGCGIDIRVGSFNKLVENDYGFLENDGRKLRRTPDVVCTQAHNVEIEESEQSFIDLHYSDYFIIETMERFAIPINLAGIIFPRTTLLRSGLQLFTSLVAPGYGLKIGGSTLTFGLVNLGKSPFRIQLGARIAQIVFFEIDGETTAYRGQWQDDHGKVRTDTEIQR